jgi:protein involved in sex pheromone biosynthesis
MKKLLILIAIPSTLFLASCEKYVKVTETITVEHFVPLSEVTK